MVLLMRGLWMQALVVGCAVASLAACKPVITGDTYYCGPEALCPPNLSCQLGDLESFAFNCVIPRAADPFLCPQVTLDREPDQVQEDGYSLGVLGCGEQLTSTNWGCIIDGVDVDHFALVTEDVCAGSNPRFKASLRFPVGAAPLLLELLNDNGEVVATSELCTPDLDTTGTDLQCIEEAGLPVGAYHLRIKIDDDANADCGGECRFNRYQLFVSSLLS
jgi:hypothetical protein